MYVCGYACICAVFPKQPARSLIFPTLISTAAYFWVAHTFLRGGDRYFFGKYRNLLRLHTCLTMDRAIDQAVPDNEEQECARLNQSHLLVIQSLNSKKSRDGNG